MGNTRENLSMHFDSVEKRIVDILNAILRDAKQQGWEWNMTKWTKRLNEDLGNLAHEHELGYRVACRDYEHADEKGEWLYDMVWWKEDGEYMSRIVLVLESEWSPDPKVDGDFLKLLLARADHHVWVFQEKTEDTVRQHMERCKEHLRQFQSLPSGDRFLFAGVSENPRQFYFDLYVHT